ncbi:MAG TPA: hypothetical protein VKR55_15820 [Bradyrhizobium sp.]|uniref:hypothetical protein n=1 Tax=Bradyrhizobium sp. TaxID=376 RepID=UPI002C68A7ED|nr:hypothetical protein [Bradyrhizobium sp.]HLZ03602.1 hypothetical protein [Bradyrhizobium sp.]
MANERIPPDPYDPYRSGLSDDNFGRQNRFDDSSQVDPALQDGTTSSSKIALFAVGIAVLLGALFYGLNNTSVKEAQTPPPARTAQTQNTAPPAAPPGMRDVTPKANNAPGVTTGSAPAAPNNKPAEPNNK